MPFLSEFLASTDSALRGAFVVALQSLALLAVGALALLVGAAARHAFATGPRWRWFGWFALIKGFAVMASLAFGLAWSENTPAFFAALYLGVHLPAWCAGARFAWESLRVSPVWAGPRLPVYLILGAAGACLLLGGLRAFESLHFALAVVVGGAVLAALGRELLALRRAGRVRSAAGILLVGAGLAGLLLIELQGADYHHRLQGWTLNTLPEHARGDLGLLPHAAVCALLLAAGWCLWMRAHVRRVAAHGWLARSLWIVPLCLLLLCVSGFALLNHVKLSGGQRADEIYARRTLAATLALDLADGRELVRAATHDDEERRAELGALLTRIADADPDFEAVAVVRAAPGGDLVVLAAARSDAAAIPPRATLWRERGAADLRFATANAPFATSFMQDARGTFALYAAPWPAPGEGWLVCRVGFTAWGETVGPLLLQTTWTVLLACVLVVAVVILLIQRELAAGVRLDLVRAAAANEAKSELLAHVSHELRTPIQGVLGYADLLARSGLDPRQDEWLRALRSQGGHLLRLVNDLIDYGALQNGRLALAESVLSPAEIAREALATVRPQAEARGLVCTLAIEEGAPAWVRGDPTRLRQILVNLLGNAVKFTASGEVALRVNARENPLPDGRRRLLFSVADTGPGIAPEELPGLFDPRGRRLRHPASGAGLGLAITRSLCRLMDGDLRVENAPGGGAVFTAEAALAPALAPARPRPSAADSRSTGLGLRVLVVEDNSALRRLLSTWLDELGCRTALAANGETALALAHAQAFDVAVLDLGLPGIDGCETARRLRARPASAGLRIIGLSAHAADADRAAALAAGMDAFLSKPVGLEALAAALRGEKPAAVAPAPEGLLAGLAPEQVADLLASADRDGAARRDELRAALESGDWPRVAKLAHYLANTADLLGDDGLRAACAACEDAALAGDAERARAAAAELLAGRRRAGD